VGKFAASIEGLSKNQKCFSFGGFAYLTPSLPLDPAGGSL